VIRFINDHFKDHLMSTEQVTEQLTILLMLSPEHRGCVNQRAGGGNPIDCRTADFEASLDVSISGTHHESGQARTNKSVRGKER